MSSPRERRDTVIAGGGQAGLATSYLLSREGLDHVVLERRSGVGDTWRARWDLARNDVPATFRSRW